MKFLLGAISFIGFLALIVSVGYLGMGILLEAGQNKINNQEEVIRQEISFQESTVINSIEIKNVYLSKNFKTVVFNTLVEKPDTYEIRVLEAKLSDLDDVTVLNPVNYGNLRDVSQILRLDTTEMKGNAITFMIISLSTWIGFWILKRLA